MSIIILVFTLGMMAVNFVLSSNSVIEQYHAGQALRNIAAQSRRDQSYFAEDIETERFLVRKAAIVHPQFEGAILLQLEAYGKNARKIGSYYEIIPREP